MMIWYFSSISENTHRFIQKLRLPAMRIPLHATETPVRADNPYIMVTPTYGGGGRRGADVPKQVIRFLNDPDNRALLRGVIASGNTNFGADFCKAGEIVSEKCQVPLLYRFELLGTSLDVTEVQSIMEKI